MQMSEEKDWDLVIEPKSKILDLKLNVVWVYRDLLLLLVKRDFVAFYKQTILGPVWFFIQPIFTTAIYVFIFNNLAGIGTDGIKPPLFYVAGITAWSYFGECSNKTANVFRDNASMFGKVYFPRLIMPLSIIASNLIKFFVQMILLISLMIYYWVTEDIMEVTKYIILFPYLVILMASLGMGIGLIVSSLTTKYRDVAMLLNFVIQLLMYAAPVVYPLSNLHGIARLLVSLNPMTNIIEGIRLGFLGHGSFTFGGLLYSTLITIFLLIIGMIIFNKAEKNFVDTI